MQQIAAFLEAGEALKHAKTANAEANFNDYIYIYSGGPEHIHARSIDEQSQVFRASHDPDTASSNSFFGRLFIRLSLSSAVERPSEADRAGLSSNFARPGDAEQARAAISIAPARPSELERPRPARVFLVFSSFLKVS